jgi:hypothetical protein
MIESWISEVGVDAIVGVKVGKEVGEGCVGVRLGYGVGELTCGEGVISKRDGIHAHRNSMPMSKRK